MELQNSTGKPNRPCWTKVVAGAWIVAVTAGLVIVWRYATTATAATHPKDHWPANELISRDGELPTLVMFAHPHCPCTRASLGELAKIAAQSSGRFAGWVVFYQPDQAAAGWGDTDLRSTAEQIPGVRVVSDVDGRLAHRFRVTTSGHTLLYSPSGVLLFSGGITAARGHAGDNAGASSVVLLLAGLPSDIVRTPVFGCSIFNETPSP